MFSKKKLKKWIAATADAAGAFRLIASTRKGMATVFMYHRVLLSPVEEPVFVQPGMYVLAETFRSHIRFLKSHFHVLQLSELVDRFDAGKNVDNCCAITFDDGWLDNYVNAFPVLSEYEVPATIFLATGFVGTDHLFWPEEFTFYLKQAEVRSALGQWQNFDKLSKRTAGNCGGTAWLDDAIMELKTWPVHEREDALSRLRSFDRADQPQRLLMNWDEAREMQASGLVSFGAHTANHVILDQVTAPHAEEEIVQSQKDIEQNLGISPEFFAYPNGNFTPGVKAILKRHGYRGAVTTRKGWVEKNFDPFEISRIGMHEDVSRSIPLFLARVYLRGF